MNIAFDLDDVLLDLNDAIIKYCKELGWKWEPAKDWNFSNYPVEVKKKVIEAFSDPEFMCTLKPHKKSIELINKLKKCSYKVIIITARSLKEETKKLVKELFDVPCFVVGFNESKLKILKTIKKE